MQAMTLTSTSLFISLTFFLLLSNIGTCYRHGEPRIRPGNEWDFGRLSFPYYGQTESEHGRWEQSSGKVHPRIPIGPLDPARRYKGTSSKYKNRQSTSSEYGYEPPLTFDPLSTNSGEETWLQSSYLKPPTRSSAKIKSRSKTGEMYDYKHYDQEIYGGFLKNFENFVSNLPNTNNNEYGKEGHQNFFNSVQEKRISNGNFVLIAVPIKK